MGHKHQYCWKYTLKWLKTTQKRNDQFGAIFRKMPTSGGTNRCVDLNSASICSSLQCHIAVILKDEVQQNTHSYWTIYCFRNLLGIPSKILNKKQNKTKQNKTNKQTKKHLHFHKIVPLSAKSFTGCISIFIWIFIMSIFFFWKLRALVRRFCNIRLKWKLCQVDKISCPF